MARFENVKPLLNMLKEQEIVNWHVVTDDDLKFRLEFDETWVKSYICPNAGNDFWARSNLSLNWFIENHMLDDEYYCFLNDDDAYEPNFFKNLEENLQISKSLGLSDDVMISAMERGDRTPEGLVPEKRHPTNRLSAHPGHMHVGGVGVEQIIAKGSLMKRYRIPIDVYGDGMFIQKITSENNALYFDNVNVWFNYYEPGRWDK